MKTLDYNRDPRPLPYRSPECRPSLAPSSEKALLQLVNPTFKSLARCLRRRFSPPRHNPDLECGATKTNQSP
jgi:hypothetical protein